MKYPVSVPGIGLVGGKFSDGNPGMGIPASLDPAVHVNALTDEIINVQSLAGLVASEADVSQLSQALQNGGLTSCAAAGAADALTATLPSFLVALKDRMSIVVMASTANATATPTFNLTLGTTATGAKSLVKGANSPLLPGDIPGANYPLELTYSAALDKWILCNPALQVLGVGQTWQDVKASRVSGTTYYNTTSKPIMVSVGGAASNSNWSMQATVGGVLISTQAFTTTQAATSTMSFIVPPGAAYSVASTGASSAFYTWAELR